jgi:hypothetical protein
MNSLAKSTVAETPYVIIESSEYKTRRTSIVVRRAMMELTRIWKRVGGPGWGI